MIPQQFIVKWQQANLTERGASKEDGGEAWVDVWNEAFFGWEYKGKHKDFNTAYRQLVQFREPIEYPPPPTFPRRTRSNPASPPQRFNVLCTSASATNP